MRRRARNPSPKPRPPPPDPTRPERLRITREKRKTRRSTYSIPTTERRAPEVVSIDRWPHHEASDHPLKHKMANKIHKILLYTDTPLFGGAEKQMLLLAKNLNKLLFEVIIVCRKIEILRPLIDEANDLKIKTYLINSKSKHSLNNLTELNKIIKTEKPDLIHVQAWNPMAGKFAILAARQNKIPLIVTEHDPFPLNWPKSLYKKWANQKVAKMITVSHTNQKMLEEIYPEMIGRLTTVHNGIEKFAVINDGKRQQIRREIFKAGPETKIILGVGTLHERKGFKYLISAYSKIHKDYPNSRLIIAGEGPERNSLENLIKNLSLSDKVFLIGQSNDVPALMQCSNLMVLPSLKEAFGLVLLEAMQAGLPIIASKVGGIPEIISSPEKGLLIEPANKNELVKSLHKLLSKDDLSKRFSQKGIEHWKNFSAKEMAEKTGQIYQEILD